MAGYVANIEVKLPGDAIDGTLALRQVLNDHDVPTNVSVDDDRGMACIALGVDADEARDAIEQALELLDGIWEDAFEELSPSPVMIVRVLPVRRAEQMNLLMPNTEDPAEEDEEPDAELDEADVL